jgi:hypothetical protein
MTEFCPADGSSVGEASAQAEGSIYEITKWAKLPNSEGRWGRPLRGFCCAAQDESGFFVPKLRQRYLGTRDESHFQMGRVALKFAQRIAEVTAED